MNDSCHAWMAIISDVLPRKPKIAPQVEDALSGVVLEKSLETRLGRVAQSTYNTKRNNAPFRHLLLYGKQKRRANGRGQPRSAEGAQQPRPP